MMSNEIKTIFFERNFIVTGGDEKDKWVFIYELDNYFSTILEIKRSEWPPRGLQSFRLSCRG